MFVFVQGATRRDASERGVGCRWSKKARRFLFTTHYEKARGGSGEQNKKGQSYLLANEEYRASAEQDTRHASELRAKACT